MCDLITYNLGYHELSFAYLKFHKSYKVVPNIKYISEK